MIVGGRRRAGGWTRPPREIVITLVLLATLLGTVLALGSRAPEPAPYDLDSGAHDGLLALRLWLGEMGYTVATTDGERFVFPHEADLLFIYPGVVRYTTAEATRLAEWVRAGGTLVLVGPRPGERALFDTFGVARQGGVPPNPAEPVRQVQPLWPEAPATLGPVGAAPTLELGRAAAVAAAATDSGQVVVAVQAVGQGVVWHLNTGYDLANLKLALANQGVLVPALLRQVPAGGRVVFDTYHLFGPREARVPTLQDWLYGAPIGWAILFGCLVLALFLVLRGIRLGRPLPATIDPRRREAAEYVTALAGLQRRARLGAAVAAHHKRRLKAGLGRRWQVAPDLADAAFVERLRHGEARLGEEQAARVREVLHGLSGAPEEAALVRLVAEVDRVLEQH
jgi:hypothetical protein